MPKEVGKVGAESHTFIEPIAQRRDGIQAMFAKQNQKQSPSMSQKSPSTSVKRKRSMSLEKSPLSSSAKKAQRTGKQVAPQVIDLCDDDETQYEAKVEKMNAWEDDSEVEYIAQADVGNNDSTKVSAPPDCFRSATNAYRRRNPQQARRFVASVMHASVRCIDDKTSEVTVADEGCACQGKNYTAYICRPPLMMEHLDTRISSEDCEQRPKRLREDYVFLSENLTLTVVWYSAFLLLFLGWRCMAWPCLCYIATT